MPVTVMRNVKETVVENVPYTEVRHVTEVCKKQVPYRTMRTADGATATPAAKALSPVRMAAAPALRAPKVRGGCSEGPGKIFVEGAKCMGTRTVTRTRMVHETQTRQVPTTVTRMVHETHCKKVPYTVTKMVPHEVCKQVPTKVCTMQTCTVKKRVPYEVCKQVPVHHVRQGALHHDGNGADLREEESAGRARKRSSASRRRGRSKCRAKAAHRRASRRSRAAAARRAPLQADDGLRMLLALRQ